MPTSSPESDDDRRPSRSSSHRARRADDPVAALLRRDRAVILAGVAALTALAWAYTVHMAGAMTPERMAMPMPRGQAWGAGDYGFLFPMWAVMMAAMMLPSAAPILLLVAGMSRRRRERGSPAVPTTVFLVGYLLVWTAYAAVAALAQLTLHNGALLSPMMVSASPALGGAILITAGVYQLTPLKRVCLAHCRSPFHVLSTQWREGTAGALRLGIRHGTYCVGCCWILMGLLFVAGVMNLLWVAAIATFVLLEKVAPAGRWIGRVAGLLLAVGGALLLASAPR